MKCSEEANYSSRSRGAIYLQEGEGLALPSSLSLPHTPLFFPVRKILM